MPWEGGSRRIRLQLADVGSGQGIHRVLPTPPPHHECNKRSDFPGNGALRQCSEGLGAGVGGQEGCDNGKTGGRENSLSKVREAITYSFLDVF